MSDNKFYINNREISRHVPPYIIAEVSANHNGSLKKALETIKAAKKVGVNAIKIQTYTPDTMTIQTDNKDFLIEQGLWKNRTLYDLYSEAYTPYEWHKEIFNFAKKENPNVKKIYLKKNSNLGIPFDSSISTSKLRKILRKNKN